MRIVIIASGLLTVIISAFVEKAEFGVVPGLVYIAANLALIAGFLGKRFTLKRMAVAVAVLALSLRVTYSGLSSLRHRVYAVSPSMSVEDVRHHMAGLELHSNFDGSLGVRDPFASPSHVAYGVVVFRDGRVSEVQFVPD